MTGPSEVRLLDGRPRALRLGRADLATLLAHPKFEVSPTAELNRFRVTAHGVAGTLHTATRRFVIRPKVPRSNLFLLLDPESPPVSSDLDRGTVASSTAIDFLAQRLSQRMRERAAAGLRHGYLERADEQAFLQGRLDVAAQVREFRANKLHVVRQEFSADTVLNRIPKATAELMAASSLLSTSTRRSLTTALSAYAEVATAPIEPRAFNHIVYDRFTEADRPLIELCRLITESLQPTSVPGRQAAPVFLLDLESAFEGYLERGLRVQLGEKLEVQRVFSYHDPVPPGQPTLTGRPDYVVRDGDRVRCVLDAKWKILDGPPPAADVHQALAYAAGLGCNDVRLVYPGRRSTAWRYKLTGGPVALTVHSVRVVGPREKCLGSLQRLSKSLG